MIKLSAAGRAGIPDEVEAVAALLMGPDGTFITGSDFLMDGGVTAALPTCSPLFSRRGPCRFTSCDASIRCYCPSGLSLRDWKATDRGWQTRIAERLGKVR